MPHTSRVHLHTHCSLVSHRRESNRHTNVLTKSGKQTTSRTAQALTSVTAQQLSGHRTIKRLIEKSALKRFARFNKQGRRPKYVVKTEDPPCALAATPTIDAAATPSHLKSTTKSLRLKEKGINARAAPKQLTTKAKKLMKNQRKQARVLAVILKRSQPNKK